MQNEQSDWICIDCVADPCEHETHAWVRARRVEYEEGDAWLVEPDETE